MDKPTEQAIQQEDRGDAFQSYRGRILSALAIASVVILLPFAVNDFLEDRIAIGVAMLAIELIVTVDAWAIHRGKPPPIPLWTLVFPALANLFLALIQPLYVNLTWAYPMVALFYFVLPQRTANWLAAVMVAAITGLAYYAFALMPFQLRAATRLGASLALVALLSNAFINVITELHRKLQRQAIIDPLTDAYNRRHMDTVLADAHARAGRGAPTPALLLLDIDHFKDVNDAYGHSTGDRVLREVVTVIRAHVRSSDTLFRCGGEEFALFLPETTLQGAAVVAEQVREAVAQAGLLEHRPVTISIGVTSLSHGETLDDWLRHGDAALYCAKKKGRNCVCTRSDTALVPVPAPAATPV